MENFIFDRRSIKISEYIKTDTYLIMTRLVYFRPAYVDPNTRLPLLQRKANRLFRYDIDHEKNRLLTSRNQGPYAKLHDRAPVH